MIALTNPRIIAFETVHSQAYPPKHQFNYASTQHVVNERAVHLAYWFGQQL